MWILCALIGLCQIVVLLMLSGVLFSIAAVSRLMEITIIIINPAASFLLRQSTHLIIILTILVAEMTSSVFHKLCTNVKSDEANPHRANPQEANPWQMLSINMQTPFIPYKRCVLEELPSEIRSSEIKSPFLLSNKGIFEPFIPYKKYVLEELPSEFRPTETESPALSSANKGIIEPESISETMIQKYQL